MRLVVDGALVHTPRPGRVAAKEQHLAAGLHSIEVDAAARRRRRRRRARRCDRRDQPWRAPLARPRRRRGRAARRGARAARRARRSRSCARSTWRRAIVTTRWRRWLVALAAGRARRRRARRLRARARRRSAGAEARRHARASSPSCGRCCRRCFAPGFYACHEEESYIVRLAEYKLALVGGVPMGRWWPDPVFGRGYPFLCLYAPLLYLVATPLLLVGSRRCRRSRCISIALVVVGAAADLSHGAPARLASGGAGGGDAVHLRAVPADQPVGARRSRRVARLRLLPAGAARRSSARSTPTKPRRADVACAGAGAVRARLPATTSPPTSRVYFLVPVARPAAGAAHRRPRRPAPRRRRRRARLPAHRRATPCPPSATPSASGWSA